MAGIDPTLSQLVSFFANATPYGTIVVFVVLLITDTLGPSKLRRAADARADAAIGAVAALTDKLEKQTAATELLTREHKEERDDWQQEFAGLNRELASLTGRVRRT